MGFIEHFQKQVKEDTAHSAINAMKMALDQAVPQMRKGKVLFIEVMCLKSLAAYAAAMDGERIDDANTSVAVVATQQSFVASNKYGVSSEMLHANLWKMAMDLNK